MDSITKSIFIARANSILAKDAAFRERIKNEKVQLSKEIAKSMSSIRRIRPSLENKTWIDQVWITGVRFEDKVYLNTTNRDGDRRKVELENLIPSDVK